jgi:hypothetical protein
MHNLFSTQRSIVRGFTNRKRLVQFGLTRNDSDSQGFHTCKSDSESSELNQPTSGGVVLGRPILNLDKSTSNNGRYITANTPGYQTFKSANSVVSGSR